MTFPPLSPTLDLELVREVPLSPEELFAGWTVPDILKQWFCPRPWKVVECEIDLRSGGLFANTMQGPDGTRMPRGEGCWLAIEPPRRLVWTNMFAADFRPKRNSAPGFDFVCELHFDPLPNGQTRYHARVMHADAIGKAQHEAMGFAIGWSTALDQLVELKHNKR